MLGSSFIQQFPVEIENDSLTFYLSSSALSGSRIGQEERKAFSAVVAGFIGGLIMMATVGYLWTTLPKYRSQNRQNMAESD